MYAYSKRNLSKSRSPNKHTTPIAVKQNHFSTSKSLSAPQVSNRSPRSKLRMNVHQENYQDLRNLKNYFHL